MSTQRAGVNAIQVGDVELLLCEVSGGEVVHLSAAVGPGETGREAVPADFLQSRNRGPSLLGYDLVQLATARWNPLTLCGREWAGMAPGEGGAIYWPNDEEAYAPTCKRCLALMDKQFPAPQPAQHLPLVAELITRMVAEHGYAEVHGVPGDQQQALRQRVRVLVRERTGHGSRTYARESMVAFWSDAVREERREQIDAETRQAFEHVAELLETGETSAPDPEWRLSWDTWRTV